jgi:chorismate mutase/prephenate dehydratase
MQAMPNPSQTLEGRQIAAGDAAPPAATGAGLGELRLQIDRIDDAIHDLLMQRAEVVGQVGRLGAKGAVALRAGREADIIRRLLRRHRGLLPRRAIGRIWRELLSATTSMQGAFIITVCETDAGNGLAQLAREHFGALTPIRVHRSPAQAIAEVSSGHATAAVLPMPAEDEVVSAAWWTWLLHRDDPRIHVVARLPFWAQRSEGAPTTAALVVAATAPDPSSADRSLIGVELPLEMSRARFIGAVTAAGFSQTHILVRRQPGVPVAHVLMEIEGYVADDDARLSKLADLPRPPVVLGAYAVPLEGEGA